MPAIQDTPNIPAELYREIVEKLDYLDDRSTLLSLAVVDRAWGDESRRVMYRGLVDHAEKSNDHQRTMRTHTLFLKSVISTPLLALYVQIYYQDQLSIDPDGMRLFACWRRFVLILFHVWKNLKPLRNQSRWSICGTSRAKRFL